jgi:hypothetical protein
MALSPELAALVDQAEAALLDARIMITELKSSHAGKAQRCDHTTYMGVWRRAQSQPWTITPEEQTMLDRARVMTAEDFATLHEAPGDPWNPSEATKRRGREFSAMGEKARLASSAPPPPPVKDKRYYQKASMAGYVGQQECAAHAAEMNLPMFQYKTWLWRDEPKQATPGATPSAVAWAEKQLRSA